MTQASKPPRSTSWCTARRWRPTPCSKARARRRGCSPRAAFATCWRSAAFASRSSTTLPGRSRPRSSRASGGSRSMSASARAARSNVRSIHARYGAPSSNCSSAGPRRSRCVCSTHTRIRSRSARSVPCWTGTSRRFRIRSRPTWCRRSASTSAPAPLSSTLVCCRWCAPTSARCEADSRTSASREGCWSCNRTAASPVTARL